MTQDKQDSIDRRDRFICEKRSIKPDLNEYAFAVLIGFPLPTVRRALKREKDGDFTPKGVG